MTEKVYSHYRDTDIDALRVSHEWGVSINIAFALKYLQRAGKKAIAPYSEDLAKAIWYLTYEAVRQDNDLQTSRSIADDVTDLLSRHCPSLSYPKDSDAKQDSSDCQPCMDFASVSIPDSPEISD